VTEEDLQAIALSSTRTGEPIISEKLAVDGTQYVDSRILFIRKEATCRISSHWTAPSFLR
jgi:Flp pilus assembly protein CpaB